MPARPPRPEATLPARTLAWLENRPHQRRFVHAVWEQLAELERVGFPWPWRPRRFPCPVWFQIGGELLEQVAERGRHRP